MRAAIITISTSRAQGGEGHEEGAHDESRHDESGHSVNRHGGSGHPESGHGESRHDESGERLAQLARGLGAEIVGRELIADERLAIEERLRHWVDGEHCELVLTTGGTGLSPSDVTPEATRAVIEREIPGVAEAMREASRAHTPHWMLSRGIAGTRGRSIIVNFPGSPASIEQAGSAIVEALPHALELLAGRRPSH